MLGAGDTEAIRSRGVSRGPFRGGRKNQARLDGRGRVSGPRADAGYRLSRSPKKLPSSTFPAKGVNMVGATYQTKLR